MHDYHLMNVAAELRAHGLHARSSDSSCTSRFPSLDLFSKLPWRAQLIDALLQYDLIGFQTLRDRRNFVQCVRALVPEARFEGKGPVLSATVGGRKIRVGAFPISIDYNAFVRQAAVARGRRAGAHELHRLLPKRKLVLGIDRLDYTKGIPHRLQAFHDLLKRYPATARAHLADPGGRAEPRRHPEYDELKSDDRAAGRAHQRRVHAARRLGAGLVRVRQPDAARSCSRTTAPPTSRSSRRCATA